MQSSNLDQALGTTIQSYRTKREWSQEYLAEMTGLHRTYISQLERGLKSPSIRVLNRITNAFEISISDFMKDIEESLNANTRRD